MVMLSMGESEELTEKVETNRKFIYEKTPIQIPREVSEYMSKEDLKRRTRY